MGDRGAAHPISDASPGWRRRPGGAPMSAGGVNRRPPAPRRLPPFVVVGHHHAPGQQPGAEVAAIGRLRVRVDPSPWASCSMLVNANPLAPPSMSRRATACARSANVRSLRACVPAPCGWPRARGAVGRRSPCRLCRNPAALRTVHAQETHAQRQGRPHRGPFGNRLQRLRRPACEGGTPSLCGVVGPAGPPQSSGRPPSRWAACPRTFARLP
jgi:hypothetical protein